MFDILNESLKAADLSPALKTLLSFLFKLGDCVAVIVIGLILLHIAKTIVKSLFAKSAKKYPTKNYETLSTLTVSVLKYSVYFFILFKVLSVFGVPVESIVAMAGVGSIAIGFGAKGIVEDCLTGITILMEDQFKVGDIIEIDTRSGTVEAIGLRTTILRSYDGNVHIIPNSVIKTVTNMSKTFNRAVVAIPISYENDIENVMNILNDEMNYLKIVLDGLINKPEVQGIVAMDNFAVTIRIIADCRVGENWSVEREMRRLIKVRFEKDNIIPPFQKSIRNER